jgi:hypothetical protein
MSSAECAAPDACGPLVEGNAAPNPPPAPAGGAIADGTYELTAVTLYTDQVPPGPLGGDSLRETFVFSGGSFRAAYLLNAQLHGGSGTYVVQGSQLQVSSSCPQATTTVTPFTAAGGEVRLYSGQPGSTTESVLTKIP